jgi:hypothetical protein
MNLPHSMALNPPLAWFLVKLLGWPASYLLWWGIKIVASLLYGGVVEMIVQPATERPWEILFMLPLVLSLVFLVVGCLACLLLPFV